MIWWQYVEDASRPGRPVDADKDTTKVFVNESRRDGWKVQFIEYNNYLSSENMGLTSKLDIWASYSDQEEIVHRHVDFVLSWTVFYLLYTYLLLFPLLIFKKAPLKEEQWIVTSILVVTKMINAFNYVYLYIFFFYLIIIK